MNDDAKKHPCADCLCCQWCSDSRCGMCLRRKGRGCRKLSLREQIELFEELNRKG